MNAQLITALLLFSIPAIGQTTFTQSCSDPKYPSAEATSIDSSCGIQGKGGSEANQNEAKNNFCASGSESITITKMASLQKSVQADKTIPFGNPDQHPLTTSAGPATDRDPLKKLGEGNEVPLVGFVKIARQEGAESVNCGTNIPNEDSDHDIHISIVDTPGKSECSGVVVEMIPHHRPASWTAGLINQVGKAQRPVRITGQLMFDSSHSPCISAKPVKRDPARGSL